jgi:uncharacterized protein YjdB
MRSLFVRAAVAALLLLVAACDRSTVPEIVASVEVSASRQELAVGDTVRLTATPRTADGRALATRRVAWESSDPQRVSVDSLGLARALLPGAAVISAVVDGVSGSMALQVVPGPPATLVIVPDSLVLIEGQERSVTAAVSDAWGNTISGSLVQWSSSDSAVVRVTPDALIAGRRPGQAVVTARLGALTNSMLVTVTSLPLLVTHDTLAMIPGVQRRLEVFQLPGPSPRRIPDARWSSSNTAVASVTADGTVSAHSPGRATLTAEHDGRSVVSEVFVRAHPSSLELVQVVTGNDHACGLTTEGAAYCWGAGPLGTNEVVDRCGRIQMAAVRVPTAQWVTYRCSAVPVAVQGGHLFRSLSSGEGHVCGLTAEGDAYCWGFNYAGRQGDGTQLTREVPVRVATDLRFRTLTAGDHTCGLTEQGVAYCWGSNLNGKLGHGSMEPLETRPVAVAGGLRWAYLSAGSFHTCGVTQEGEAYCWGTNLDDALGVGPTGEVCHVACARVPRRVLTDVRFTSVEPGGFFTCGLSRVGEALCWGAARNTGIGGSGSIPTPTPVPGGRTFTGLDVQSNGACGLTAAGELHCWGNAWPRFQQPSLTLASFSVSSDFGCGIASDAAAYCWGWDDARLGSGSPGDSFLPGFVGARRVAGQR